MIYIMRLFKGIYSKNYQALRRSPFAVAAISISFTWLVLSYFVFAFEDKAEGANIHSYGEALWWGIVTILTVGYGDRYPVTPEGRVMAGFLMFAGVSAIAIITGKITSYFFERALRERRGVVTEASLKNHFIICGWRDEMLSMLLHILDSRPDLWSEQLILVNNAPDAEIDKLLNHPRLQKIGIIKGEFWQDIYLKLAHPERAQKVLILADSAPDSTGRVPTSTEADARTVMTAMTLANIAKGTPVAAEVLDTEMEQYLKLAHVSEIIFTREYSRMMLALASSGTGVTNVFHDLLSPQSPYFLTTKPIPQNLIGGAYQALAQHFEKDKTHLLGLLENSGNAQTAREYAIKKAQQTPDIEQLVNNLQNVKSMRFNKPVFVPSPDYKILEGSMAIVMEDRQK